MLFDYCLIMSNYFDLSQFEDYWSERRLNYYIEVIMMFYVLWEGVCLVFEEGFEEWFCRYCCYEKVFMVGFLVMGFDLFGDLEVKLFVVICVQIL